MKRFFICAAAAIVALASCSKTEVVNTSAPEEIGFKAVTGVMTKTLGDQAHANMGVFASKSADDSEYFGNTEFIEGDNNVWTGATAQYWPLEGSLDFALYAPFSNSADRDFADNTLSIVVDNSEDQTDWLYGTEVITGTKQNTAMSVDLRHALAKINATVTADLAGLKVISLVVTETVQNGVLTVDYAGTDADLTDGDSRLSWDIANDVITKDWTLIGANTLAKDSPVEGSCYVIPSEQTSLVLTYSLPESQTPLTYTHTFGNARWVDGKSYTYNIKIGVNEIKFEPNVNNWATVPADDIIIDPNTPNN